MGGDFDDARRPESVAFLWLQGIDIDQARAHGVSSVAFAVKLAAVLSATPKRDELTWAAYFGGAYDFAYMVAGGRPLPETWHKFMAEAKALLGGGRVFDMMWHCERVAHLVWAAWAAWPLALACGGSATSRGCIDVPPLRRAIWRASSTRR
jgi:hypothetical protein